MKSNVYAATDALDCDEGVKFFSEKELTELGFEGGKLSKVVEKTDCIIIMMGHSKFERLNLKKIKFLAKKSPGIVDISHVIDPAKVEKYGSEELSSGPNIDNSKEIVIVEGRADVINLMRCGTYNVVAVEGARIPKTIKTLCKEKEATAFLDGDRGGDLILKELIQVTDIKYVTRAPEGREVEELNCKEIFEALEHRKPIEPLLKQTATKKVEVSTKITDILKKLEGTLEAVLLGEKESQIKPSSF